MDSAGGPDELWERVRRGDARAFTDIYDLYAQRIFNHCYRRVVSLLDAEDLTAEVFAVAWRRRADIRLVPEVGGLPWLLVTANHLMHHHRLSVTRARKLLSRLPVSGEANDHAGEIVDRLGDEYALAMIAAVLRSLSRRDRDVVQLCVLEGLTPSEVGIASGEPASSVRSRLSRALVRAREEYQILEAATAGLPAERVAE